MRIDVLSLFPEFIAQCAGFGVVGRAQERALLSLHGWNPRDHAEGGYRRVDDRPFGGGPGMVMLAQPLWQCLHAIREDRAEPAERQAPVVLFSPAGVPLTHGEVQRWAAADSVGAILVCGRYEGVDQRFIDTCVNAQISLGDFVLSGGEIPAMALLDAVARLQPGVLQDADSHAQDSFNPAVGGLLDCPHYTRPEVWQGQRVPDVLLSGNHAAIAQWRHAQRVQLTQANRPEILQKTQDE